MRSGVNFSKARELRVSIIFSGTIGGSDFWGFIIDRNLTRVEY